MVVAVFLLIGLAPGKSSALEVYIPHITGGTANWTDILQVDNIGLTSQTFTLTLYADSETVYQQALSVSGFSERVIYPKNLAPTAEAGLITYSSSMLNFRLSYENTDGGGVAEFRLTEDAYPILGLYFSDFSSDLTWKGLCLGNLNASAATVKLYAIGSGNILGSTTITISPYSKVTGIHTKWFPSLAFGDIKKIVAVSSLNLSGLASSGDGTSSFLLFTPAAEITEFSTGAAAVTTTDITGTWSGTWRSTDYFGESGSMVITAVQTGNTFTATGSFGDTDCGDVSGVSLSGTVSGSTVTFDGSYDCSGNIATLGFTNGVVVGSSMAGSYLQNVNGDYYDAGTFTLTKQ